LPRPRQPGCARLGRAAFERVNSTSPFGAVPGAPKSGTIRAQLASRPRPSGYSTVLYESVRTVRKMPVMTLDSVYAKFDAFWRTSALTDHRQNEMELKRKELEDDALCAPVATSVEADRVAYALEYIAAQLGQIDARLGPQPVEERHRHG